jgi:hypothetical protein
MSVEFMMRIPCWTKQGVFQKPHENPHLKNINIYIVQLCDLIKSQMTTKSINEKLMYILCLFICKLNAISFYVDLKLLL